MKKLNLMTDFVLVTTKVSDFIAELWWKKILVQKSTTLPNPNNYIEHILYAHGIHTILPIKAYITFHINTHCIIVPVKYKLYSGTNSS